MNTFLYEVVSIDGDYANLRRTDVESDELKLVARALLPPEIAEGTKLKYEWLQYEIIDEENGGFSLVELILTVAVMALLVCAMIPLVSSYVNRMNASADQQFADTIQKAIAVVLENPLMAEETDWGCPEPGTVLCLDRADHFQGEFGEMVAQKLGYDTAAAMTDPENGLVSKLRSAKDARIIVTINQDGSCGAVTVISEDGDPLVTAE